MPEDSTRVEVLHNLEASDRRAKHFLAYLVTLSCFLLLIVVGLSLYSDYRLQQLYNRQIAAQRNSGLRLKNALDGVQGLLQQQDQYFTCRLASNTSQVATAPNSCVLPFQK